MLIIQYLGIILAGYCIGAIPVGLILGRLIRGIDVREYGSGKTGATNVLRSAGKVAGLSTLLLDFGKGALAVYLGWIVIGTEMAQVAGGLAGIAGHTWPVFTKFRGGRGVGTYVGGLLTIYWPIGLLFGLCMGVGMIALTRYVSLASILIAVSSFLAMLTVILLGIQPAVYLLYTGVGGSLLLYHHRDNIQRLRSGTERRLGEKGAKQDPSRIGIRSKNA